jgi:putative transposase
MTALVRRTLPGASRGAVDRAMRTLGLHGVVRRQGGAHHDPGRRRPAGGDLLNRDFTADAPNRTWVMDFTYVRCWAGFVYVAFVLDVFAQKDRGLERRDDQDTDLVMTPLRMALWQRDREGHPSPRAS